MEGYIDLGDLLHTKWYGRSPMHVLTQQCMAESQPRNLLITSLMP